MEFVFKDISEGFFKAKVSDIKQENGKYGPYLRIIFTVIDEGELIHCRFSGIVKPIPLKQGKFYRWVTNILGNKPDHKFCTKDIVGKECRIYLAKQKNYYSVIDVSKISAE
jgi:hypothetical protein